MLIQFSGAPADDGRPGNVRFGCRLFAHMAPKPYDTQDVFIRQCLTEGENSLRAQGAGRHGTPVEISNPSWNQAEQGNAQRDGWGIASYSGSNKEPRIEKAPNPVSEDKHFTTATEDLAADPPRTILAHLRRGKQPAMSNTHPFRLNRWVLMHNGTVPPKTLAYIESQLPGLHEKFGTPLPQGSTDTERAFCYVFGRLQEKTSIRRPEELTPNAIPTAQLQNHFREMMSELVALAEQDDPIPACALGEGERAETDPTGKYQSCGPMPPGLNFILSDGDRTLACRYGRGLHLGIRTDAGGALQDIVVATQRIQPSRQSGQAAITWTEIPDAHLATLERQNGKLAYNIAPLRVSENP